MVYSSDFYTSRRPAYYKPSTSYSVTPLYSSDGYDLPPTYYKAHQVYQTCTTPTPFILTPPSSTGKPSSKVLPYNGYPYSHHHYVPLHRRSAATIHGVLDKIEHRPRSHPSYDPTDEYLNSKSATNFDDVTRDIRAQTAGLLKRIYTPTIRPKISSVSNGYSELPIAQRIESDAYIEKILADSDSYRRDNIGKGHLACVSYAGGRAYPRRRPHLSKEVDDNITMLSYYNKTREAAATSSHPTVKINSTERQTSNQNDHLNQYGYNTKNESPKTDQLTEAKDETERKFESVSVDKLKAEKEQARLEAEESARLAAEEEARLAAEEEAKLAAEEKARLVTEEEARLAAEEEARLAAEEEARLAAEEEARLAVELEKNRLAAEEEQARLEAEEKSRLEAEEKARLKAEEEAKLAAEEEAKLAAEEEARLNAEEEAKLAAEKEARLVAEEEQARLEAEEKARLASEENAKLADEEKTIEIQKSANEITTETEIEESEQHINLNERISDDIESEIGVSKSAAITSTTTSTELINEDDGEVKTTAIFQRTIKKTTTITSSSTVLSENDDDVSTTVEIREVVEEDGDSGDDTEHQDAAQAEGQESSEEEDESESEEE